MAGIHLSVVVPAHNEAARIDSTLRTIRAYADAQPFPVEVIVVDDGSTDATAQLAACPRRSTKSVRGWAGRRLLLRTVSTT